MVLAGSMPHHRLVIRCVQVTVDAVLNPLKGGANSALVLHLAKGSVDAAFVAEVGAKEHNQDRLLGLLLLLCRYVLCACVREQHGGTLDACSCLGVVLCCEQVWRPAVGGAEHASCVGCTSPGVDPAHCLQLPGGTRVALEHTQP